MSVQKWLPVLQLNLRRCRRGGQGQGGGGAAAAAAAAAAMRMHRVGIVSSDGFGHSVMRSTLGGRAKDRRTRTAAAATAATATAAPTATASSVGRSVKDADGTGAGLRGGSVRGESRSDGQKAGTPPPRTAPGAHLSQRTRLWILGFSAVAFVLGGYVSSKFVGNPRKDDPVASNVSRSGDTTGLEQPGSSTSPSDPVTVYERPGFAAAFDSETGSHESIWGILSMRQRLVEQATGRVMEVGAGTGRNTEFYQLAQCDSVTLLDQSGAMLDVARKKWEESKKTKIKDAEECDNGEERRRRLLMAEVESGKVRFLQMSIFDVARSAIGSNQKKTTTKTTDTKSKKASMSEDHDGNGSYDTVVETMSLCSTQRPDDLLQSLGALVKPESGRILLLEHGRSRFGFLNRWLDNSAEPHAEKFGCWWNRDVGALVERSGLEVLEMRRHHLGTTWWVVLRRPIGWEPRIEGEGSDDGEGMGRDGAS